MIGARRMQPQCPMRAPTVVVSAVAGKDGPQVPLTEDQDPVGEFGSGGQHESFGEAVRSRTSSWNLHGGDAGSGQDAEIFNFVTDVDSGQRAEIRIMQTMLGEKP